MDDLTVARFSLWDYGVFAFMLSISAAIGLYAACSGSRNKTAREYLVGNRSLGTLPVALSLLASFNSGIVMLSIPAEIYTFGAQFWFIQLGFLIALPISALVFMPMFYKLGGTSVYEYLEKRYGRVTRMVCTILFIIQMTFYTAISIYMPSLAMSQVTKINQWLLVIITSIVCVFYTTIGGIRAVIFTDVFQVVIMFATEMIVIFLGSHELGGMEKVMETAYEGGRINFPNFSLDPTVRVTFWNCVIGATFTWIAIFGCNQTQVQRYVSMKSIGAAKNAILYNIFGIIILSTACMMTGLVAYAKYHDCDPGTINKISSLDQIIPIFVQETFLAYRGLSGFFIAGIYSAALSTISSTLNSLAAVTYEDIIKRYISPDIKEENSGKVSKIIASVYGILCIGLVALLDGQTGAVQIWNSVFGVIGGPIFSLFLMGMFMPRINQKAALAGVIVSFAFCFWIIIGAFLYNPLPVKLPVSTEGCYGNSTVQFQPVIQTNLEESYVFPLYKISFMWYSVISSLIVIVVAYVCSIFWENRDVDKLDKDLLSPWISQYKIAANNNRELALLNGKN